MKRINICFLLCSMLILVFTFNLVHSYSWTMKASGKGKYVGRRSELPGYLLKKGSIKSGAVYDTWKRHVPYLTVSIYKTCTLFRKKYFFKLGCMDGTIVSAFEFECQTRSVKKFNPSGHCWARFICVWVWNWNTRIKRNWQTVESRKSVL